MHSQLFNVLIYLFSHLADTFIQSELQIYYITNIFNSAPEI